MRQHRTLGQARRPAGVLEDGHVLGRVDRHPHRVAAVRGQVGEAQVAPVVQRRGDVLAPHDREEKALGERQDVLHAADDDPLQRRPPEHLAQLAQQRLEVEGDHEPDAAVRDLALDLPFGVERVEVHHRAAGLQHPEEGDHVIGRVGEEEAHPVTLADAQVLQALGEPVDQRTDRAIGVAATEEVEERAVGIATDRVVEQVRHRARRDRRVPVDAGRIGLQPGRIGPFRRRRGGRHRFPLPLRTGRSDARAASRFPSR